MPKVDSLVDITSPNEFLETLKNNALDKLFLERRSL